MDGWPGCGLPTSDPYVVRAGTVGTDVPYRGRYVRTYVRILDTGKYILRTTLLHSYGTLRYYFLAVVSQSFLYREDGFTRTASMRIFTVTLLAVLRTACSFSFDVAAGKVECFHELTNTSDHVSGDWHLRKKEDGDEMLTLDVQVGTPDCKETPFHTPQTRLCLPFPRANPGDESRWAPCIQCRA